MVAGPRSSRHSGMGQQPVLLLFVVLVVSGAMVARLAWLQLVQAVKTRPGPMKTAFG
jgi:penicillin-binding protein 2